MGVCTSKKNSGSSREVDSGRASRKDLGAVNMKGEQTPKAFSEEQLRIKSTDFIGMKSGHIRSEYNLSGIISKGAYGEVYKAQHKQTSSLRAVKKLYKAEAEDQHGVLNKFLAEFAIVRELQHPNILRVYEIFEDAAYFYIVSEYIKGGELFDYIRSNLSLSEPIACHVFLQLASAVNYVHKQGVIHRDLKPDNILIDYKETAKAGERIHVKLIDFGTSILVTGKQKLHDRQGTPYYIAPEVLNGNYDHKCDVWSLGVILFILLSGCPPFNGQSNEEIYMEIKNKTLAFPSKYWSRISPEAQDLLQHLLRKNPNQRISLEDAEKHPWVKKCQAMDPQNSQMLKNALGNISHYHRTNKLQSAVGLLIASQIQTTNQDVIELQKAFEKLDDNQDGKISREELLSGYEAVFNQTITPEEVDNMIKLADADGSGFLEYDEFITAAMNPKELYSKHNLMRAFKLFDSDKSGTISTQELKEAIGQSLASDEVWQKLMESADADGSGEIDLQEFQKLFLST